MSLSFLKSVLIPVSYSGYVLLQKIYPPLAGLISFPDLFIQENPCPLLHKMKFSHIQFILCFIFHMFPCCMKKTPQKNLFHYQMQNKEHGRKRQG